ncbi:hypothetical protein R9X47_24385 [Wukongibacter baidiensis]|uniref:hypothetical protein n=1 Tax=Wukongibacter baidiensis TaxID=1723361 RepID=UPI003D7FD0A4
MVDLNLYETVILPVVTANTAISVDSPLYTIESVNTTEARIQSVAASTGNEHTVQKSSNESLIATKIPQGEVAILTSAPANERQVAQPLGVILLKSRL